MAVQDISNDTRGWIMCIVSGIGACSPPLPPSHKGGRFSLVPSRSQPHHPPEASANIVPPHSLCCRRLCDMRRSVDLQIPGHERFPYPRQQWLPGILAKLELRCHGTLSDTSSLPRIASHVAEL